MTRDVVATEPGSVPNGSDWQGALGNTWVIVLAAGDGNRLRSLTTTDLAGAVPKQFCSLNGGPSLLHEALRRAASIAQSRHVCAIVAEQHRRWWNHALRSFDEQNTIVQPANRGTGNGVLLPLMHIMRRDPAAHIVLLPSDHYIDDEAALFRALRRALRTVETRADEIVLLGIAPDRADSELGYIVPGSSDATGTWAVDRFVEKPSLAVAQSLIDAGALWNAFIVVASARTLLGSYVARFPRIVADMRRAVEADAHRTNDPVALRQLYRNLTELDFSRHVVEAAGERLRVLPVPPCGWCDLGTPLRVAETLAKLPAPSCSRSTRSAAPFAGVLNLAVQYAALHQLHHPNGEQPNAQQHPAIAARATHPDL